jgi:L-ascorbate metabolism protein UlaG (beta-lactamase superfamily)
VTMVPAEHSAGNLVGETDDAPVHLGEPVGFVVEMEDGYRVYHAGDTAVFSDMRLIRDLFAPDLALLPIGGHYTMDPRGAALAVELLGVEDVIPMHYGTFPILAGTPAQLEEELGRRGLTGVTVHAPKPGETVA